MTSKVYAQFIIDDELKLMLFRVATGIHKWTQLNNYNLQSALSNNKQL